ncbi:HTH-type transcriptional activator Btr [compost metagenome]
MLVSLPKEAATEEFFCEVKGRLRELKCGWVGAMSGRQIPIIVFRATNLSYRAQGAALVKQLLYLQRHQKSAGEIFVGIGRPYEGLDQIKLSYQEALLATVQTGLPARHRYYEDMETPSSGSMCGYQDQQSEKRFIDNIRLGQWDAVRGTVMELMEYHEKNDAALAQSGQWVLERLWIIARVAMEMGIEVEKPLFSFQVQNYQQLRAEAESLLNKLIDSIVHHQSRMQPGTVERMKQYIMAHSEKDISLESMASEIGLSPFYISKLFKEQLGVNYIDFLTECRVEKAKQLMSDPSLSLKEITYEVGYHDPNYFSKVFKKVCGASPTDYRKGILTRKA